MSTLTQVPFIADPGPSRATPGLWNRIFSVLSQNADTVNGIIETGVVTQIGGTPHQITSSASTGAVNFSLPSALTIPGTLEVTSGASFLSTLSVAGAAKFVSTVSVDGATRLGSTLSVTGHTIHGSTFSQVGAAQFASTVSADGAVDLGSTLSVVGATQLGSGMTVVGDVRSTSSVSVAGAVVVGSFLTVGRESFGSAFYITSALKTTAASNKTVEFGWTDINAPGGFQMGFFRSANSATMYYSGGTFVEIGSGTKLSVLTVTGDITTSGGIVKSQNNPGAFEFNFAGSGLVQNSAGFSLKNASSPSIVKLGVESSGKSFFVGTGRFSSTPFPSVNTYLAQVNGDLAMNGSLSLAGQRLLSVRTVGSVDSTQMELYELTIGLNQASGISLAFRSNGTIWYFESSQSTKG